MSNPQPGPLSGETQARIDALARKISVAQQLDEEIRAELRSHIEDKVSAYLTGEELRCEADALVLAQTHFGNPATVNALLLAAHRQPLPLARSVGQRLIIITLATLIVCPTIDLLANTASAYLLYPAFVKAYETQTPLGGWDPRLQWVASPILQILALAVTLLILRRRERAAARAPQNRPLLARWIVALIALSIPIAAYFAMEPIGAFLMPLTVAGASVPGPVHFNSSLNRLFPLLESAGFAATFFLWLWWIGPSRSRFQVLLATAGAWIVARCLLTLPVAVDYTFFRRLPMPRTPGDDWFFAPVVTYYHVLSHWLPLLAECLVLYAVVHYLHQKLHRRTPKRV